jgi:hypothetical protein
MAFSHFALNIWWIRLVLLAGLVVGVVIFVAGFVFGICGSMEYTTACNGLFAGDPDGPYWGAFVLVCSAVLASTFLGRPVNSRVVS